MDFMIEMSGISLASRAWNVSSRHETVLRLVLISMEQKPRFRLPSLFHVFHALPCQKIQGQSAMGHGPREGFCHIINLERDPPCPRRLGSNPAWLNANLAHPCSPLLTLAHPRSPSTCSSLRRYREASSTPYFRQTAAQVSARALVGFRCFWEAVGSDWLASALIISIRPPGVFGKSEMECCRRIVFVATRSVIARSD